MISISRSTFLGVCLLFPMQPGWMFAQQATPQQTATQPAPAPPKVPDVKPPRGAGELSTSDGQLSVALFYWLSPTTKPVMRSGKDAITTTPSDLDFPGKARPIPGAMISFPAKGSNTLRASYFRAESSGGLVAGKDLSFFGTGFAAGDILSTRYTLQSAKISLDYLSWPVPPQDSKFRFKTLWEVQFVSIDTRVNALSPTDGTVLDGSSGTNMIIYPTLGMGIEYALNRHFRFEAKGSGFGIPHRAAIGDAEAFAASRHGNFEIMVGGKFFYFKTSPTREEYVRGTLAGAFVGLRWYP